MLLIALLAAAASAPQPSEVRTFQDWTVACDNGLRCEAIALLPAEAESEAWTTLNLRRGSGAGERPVVTFQGIEGRPTALLVDGRALPASFSDDDDGFTLHGDEGALLQALRSARTLEVRGADGASLGRVSLAGASAAMLYMDEKQRRVGTVTALVRPGPRPASAMPSPPSLPQVRRAPAPTDQPPAIGNARVAGLRRQFHCTLNEVGGPDEFEATQIETGKTLILLACGSGAYNLTSIPLIAQSRGGRIVAAIAPFDSQWGLTSEERRPTLINASWDPERRLLQEYSKARGLGDCGTRSDYAWDGARFRLVYQEEMEECRGSLAYLTTWRAEAR